VTGVSALVADALAIARIPAPTFDEHARLLWIGERLAGAPGGRRTDAVGNLLWEWGEGRPRLLLTAHVDTVFDHDVDLDIQQADGRLTGPGIGDNAIAVAMAISVVEEALGAGDLAAGVLAFTVGEEGLGNLRGALAAVQELEPMAMIALEGHGLDRVFVDAVGSVRANITVGGPGGHSWADAGRPSALESLFEVGLRMSDHGSDELVVNLGVVSGGRSINSIADEAQLALEARSLDEAELDGFVRALGALTVPPPLTLEVKMLGRRPAGRLARNCELLTVVREVRAELGLPCAEDVASTDANAGLAFGVPSLALGAAIGANMHTISEHIERDSLTLGRKQLLMIVQRFLVSDQPIAALTPVGG
jgi:acetylornithine deacetylase/succinyl-diaminopimelate desuccinylase-like protein